MINLTKEQAKAKKIAAELGLTEDELEALQRAAHTTYEVIGADLGKSERKGRHAGLWKRTEIIEIVLDAGRVEIFGFDRHNPITPRLKELMHSHDADGYQKLIAMVKPAFPYEWCE